MQNIIRLKKGILKYFVKKARCNSNEIQAYLIGNVVNPNLIVIDRFEYTKEYAVSTPDSVAWFTAEYERVKKKAEDGGRRIVGFVHSHPAPNEGVVMSPEDYKVCIKEMFRVCGVCSVRADKTTHVEFWVMDCALPCDIQYYEKNKGT